MTAEQGLTLAAWAVYLALDGRLTRRTGGTWRAVTAGGAVVVAALVIVVWAARPAGPVIGFAILVAQGFGRRLWVPRFGERPEAALFDAYRRFYAAAAEEAAAATDVERDRAHAAVLHELDRMEQSRTSNTGQLIDLLRQSYAARRDPTSSPDAPSDVAAKLD